MPTDRVQWLREFEKVLLRGGVMQIYKYRLFDNDISVKMNEGARVLHTGVQGTEIYVWALVDSTQPAQWRRIVSVATGPHVDGLGSAQYVGTVQVNMLVWHVFDFGPCEDPAKPLSPE